MQLESLHIERNRYGFEHSGLAPNAVGGKIKFSGAGGSNVEVVLQPHHIDSILAVIADSLVEHTRELATTLTAQIIEHATLPALTAEAA